MVAALAAAALMLVPSSAMARAGVYGGASRAGDPIVLKTDAAGKKLTEAVFRVCVDGQDNWWPIFDDAKVVRPSANPMVLQTGALVADKNSGGRFTVKYLTVLGTTDTQSMMGGIALKGTLKAGRATGTIDGWVTVTDTTTGQLAGSYDTKPIKWTAERSPGHVYGGALKGSLPVVIMVNQKATKVTDLWLSCYTDQTTPPGSMWSSSEALGNFKLAHGQFGADFSYPERESDGSTTTYGWKVHGRVTPTVATGTIALDVTGTYDGAPTSATMPVSHFTAATG